MKKITRRTVLRVSGLAAASLALSGCAPTGSACVGNGFSGWLQQTFGKGSSASSESTEAAAPGTQERHPKPRQRVPTAACPPITPTPLPASRAAATAVLSA